MSRRFAWLAGVAAALGACAADWAQWRGPNRDGRSEETGLIKALTAAGPRKLWTADGLGGGYSTPSVAGGKIYGMGAVNDQEVVWALDAGGKPLWSKPIGPKGKVGYGEGPRGTPTVDGDRVYAVGVSGTLVCLGTDGTERWRRDYKKDFNGKMMSGWGYSESVLIDGDKLICTPGGDKAGLAALDKMTGKDIWTAAVPGSGGAGYASPVKASVGGVDMYVTLMGKSKGVVAVSADTGQFLWNYSKIANGTANIPTPIVRGEHIFCTTGYGDGGSALLKLAADGSGGVTATEVWYHPATKLQNHHGGCVLVGDHLYFGHGHNKGFPVCVEFMTGKAKWGPERPPAGCDGSAGVVYADGKLFFRYDSHALALIDATPARYSLKGTFRLPESSGTKSWPHPVISDGKLYIRDQGKMHCYNVRG